MGGLGCHCAGLLLRLFSYLYDMDVIEEESYFKWKEDVSEEFPGKGQALFQVTTRGTPGPRCGHTGTDQLQIPMLLTNLPVRSNVGICS